MHHPSPRRPARPRHDVDDHARRARSAVHLIAATVAIVATPTAAQDLPVDPELYSAMEWRLIGPFRGGRSVAVAGVVDDPRTYHMGTVGGGVWKTTDAVTTWTNVVDNRFPYHVYGGQQDNSSVAIASRSPAASDGRTGTTWAPRARAPRSTRTTRDSCTPAATWASSASTTTRRARRGRRSLSGHAGRAPEPRHEVSLQLERPDPRLECTIPT
jgi:hypothetical protein